MSLSALRVAIARENLDEADIPLTAEEQLMVAPPDEAAADPEVAVAMQIDAAEDSAEAVEDLLDAGAVVNDVIETVRAEGDAISPEAVIVAQERLNQVYRRLGLPTRSGARERFQKSRESHSNTEAPDAPEAKDVIDHAWAGPFSEAQDLITDAEKNLEYIKVAASEGLGNLINRMRTNAQNFFKWRTTYIKDVRAVAKAASNVAGNVNADARYTNKVRVAHFMDGEQNILSTAAQLNEAFKSSTAAASACRVLQEQMERIFVFFTKGSGQVDLSAVGRAFETSTLTTAAGSPLYSVTGKAAIFGEEMVLGGIQLERNTNSQEDLLNAVANAKFAVKWHWQVSDLEDPALPAMAPGEVAQNANALASLAAGLKQDYGILDSLADMTNNQNATLGKEILDALSNPKLYFKYRNVVRSTIAAMATAGDLNIDLKAKALNCVLDYYKWSLKQVA